MQPVALPISSASARIRSRREACCCEYAQSSNARSGATKRARFAEATGFLAAYRKALASSDAAKAQLDALAAFVRVLFGSNEFLTVD